MFITTKQGCVRRKIPENQKYIWKELLMPESARLLKIGHLSNTSVLVKVYGAEQETEGQKCM